MPTNHGALGHDSYLSEHLEVLGEALAPVLGRLAEIPAEGGGWVSWQPSARAQFPFNRCQASWRTGGKWHHCGYAAGRKSEGHLWPCCGIPVLVASHPATGQPPDKPRSGYHFKGGPDGMCIKCLEPVMGGRKECKQEDK